MKRRRDVCCLRLLPYMYAIIQVADIIIICGPCCFRFGFRSSKTDGEREKKGAENSSNWLLMNDVCWTTAYRIVTITHCFSFYERAEWGTAASRRDYRRGESRRKWLFNNPIWKIVCGGGWWWRWNFRRGSMVQACDPSNEGVSLSLLLINTDSPDNSQQSVLDYIDAQHME